MSLMVAFSLTDSCSARRRITWPQRSSSLCRRRIDTANDELGAWYQQTTRMPAARSTAPLHTRSDVKQ